MGLFGTVLAFGAGYATGMKLGDKPMEKRLSVTPVGSDGAAVGLGGTF